MTAAVDELLLTAAANRLERAAGSGTAIATPTGLGVSVVVADLNLPALVRGVVDFTAALPPDVGDRWHRAFTRTVFLAGDPVNVAARHPPRHMSADEALSWYGPATGKELTGLSRMLPGFCGPAPIDAPTAFEVRTGGPPRPSQPITAVVATGGIRTDEYLVHVHHLFAEAALRGLVRPGDTVRVEHRRRLDDPDVLRALEPGGARAVQTRIARDRQDPDKLRLYAVLTSNHEEGR